MILFASERFALCASSRRARFLVRLDALGPFPIVLQGKRLLQWSVNKRRRLALVAGFLRFGARSPLPPA